MSWRVSHLSIEGVKGVLDRAGEFDLGDGKSIAIYAPNGCGKSGYADAVEYLFSRDGCVEHLGKGGQDSESGGKHAIPHVLAAEMGITPQVAATLRHTDSRQTLQASRVVKTGRADPLPPSLEPLLDAAPAYRILRQHDLRRFVVDMPPREKYTELSRWIGLEQLELVLKHLTTTAQALAKTNPDREIEERKQDIIRHTEGTVTDWDPMAVYLWCAIRAKRHLETATTIASTADIRRTIGLLRERRNDLVLAAGRASERYTAKTKIEAFAADAASESGRIAVSKARLNLAVRAETQLRDARSAAKDSVFQEVWTAASKMLDAQVLEVCPLCRTPWEVTKAGSQQETRVYLSTSLAGLSALKDAQAKYKESVEQLNAAMTSLVLAFQDAEAQLTILGLSDLATTAKALAVKTQGPSSVKRPASEVEGQYLAVLSEVQEFLSSSVLPAAASVRVEGIPAPAQEIEETIAHFQGIESALGRLAELQRESQEYRKIEQGFSAVNAAIKQRVSELIDSVVEALRKDVTRIYRAIHPTGAVPEVHIVPDTEEKSLERVMNLG